MIPLSVPNLSKLEAARVDECIRSGWVSSAGPWVQKFEQHFAEILDVRGAVAVSTGTAAIHLALIASGVQPGDLVVVPTLTFIATVNAVRYVGAEPVFIGCDERFCLDEEAVKDFFTQECEARDGKLFHRSSRRRVSAVVPVHIFGFIASLTRILAIAEASGVSVIEDAAESVGSYREVGPESLRENAGTVGHFGCFSFNGNKIVTTGAGGMVVARDPEALQRIRYFSTQAKDDELFFVHNEIGYNYRLASVNAALGLAQLERLPEFIERKRSLHALYAKAFSGLRGAKLVAEPEGMKSNHWLNTLLFASGDLESLQRRIEFFKERGIDSRPVWKLNHLQRPYATAIRYRTETAEALYPRILNLPSSSGITDDEAGKVIDAVLELDKKLGKEETHL